MTKENIFQKTTWDYYIPNSLLLRCYCTHEVGLLSGNTGVALLFLLMQKNRHSCLYGEYAKDLLEITSNSLATLPLDFDTGLTGIGWGIDQCIKKGWMNEDANELLSDFDCDILNDYLNGSKSITETLSTTAYYLQRSIQNDNPILIDPFFEHVIPFFEKALNSLIEDIYIPPEFDILWELPWAIYLWCQLRKQNTIHSDTHLKTIISSINHIQTSDTHQLNKLMINLLSRSIYPRTNIPVPHPIPTTRLEVRSGLAGVLLLLKLFGDEREREAIIQLSAEIRNFYPPGQFQYILGKETMNGNPSLIDGISGVLLALEL